MMRVEMDAMEVIRATETWQRAGVYYVRTEAMVKGFQIPLHREFDGRDTPDTPYILVLDGVLPVGTCRVDLNTEEGYAGIERVCVLEAYRRMGVGSLAVRAAEELILERGFSRIVITSRDEAVGFYQKLGYVPDYERKLDYGIFHKTYMEKIFE